MTAAATAPDEARPNPREARAERRLAMLEALAEIGMALARDLSRRVGEGLERGEPLDGGEAALEFSRISRSVRQTLALEARLDQDRDALAKMFAAEREARETARRQHIEDRRECVRGAIDAAIEKAGGLQRKRTKLSEALDERLEDPREDDDFADLPVSALVSRICVALGVPVDWDLWKNSDWAAEEWRSARAGSPYAPMTPEAADEARVDETKADDAIRLSATIPAPPPPRRSG